MNASVSFSSKWLQATQIVLSLLLLLVATLSLAGFFSSMDNLCELFSHLRMVWIIILSGLSVALLVAKMPKFAMIGAVVLMVNGADVLRLYLPDGKHNDEAKSSKIKLLEINVMGESNHNYGAALSAVAATIAL